MVDKVSTNSMAAAFVQAQSEIGVAVKDSTNPHFKSKYADLGAVWAACRGVLAKHGFSVLQPTDFDEKDVWVVTILLHSSGESIRGRYPLRPSKQDPQGYGSALTYARRYSLASMVGIVADEDDDGNAASMPATNGTTTQRPIQPPAPPPQPVKKKTKFEQAMETISGAKTSTIDGIEQRCIARHNEGAFSKAEYEELDKAIIARRAAIGQAQSVGAPF